MTEAPTADRGPSRGARIALVLGVLIPALALDLWTKAWAWEHLRTQPGREIVKDFFYLDFAFNTGSAFGFLRDAGWSRLFFIAITVAVAITVAIAVAVAVAVWATRSCAARGAGSCRGPSAAAPRRTRCGSAPCSAPGAPWCA